MEKFTASNGVEVSITPAGSVSADGIGFPVDLTVKTSDALREFFQHERDQELGRWRWSEDPDYVVYPIRQRGSAGKPAAGLLRESTGYTSTHGRTDNSQPAPVRDYFAAHPEPRPWHDAKPGEVWAISHASGGETVWIVDEDFTTGDYLFRPVVKTDPNLVGITVTGTHIKSARRIWPEVSDG